MTALTHAKPQNVDNPQGAPSAQYQPGQIFIYTSFRCYARIERVEPDGSCFMVYSENGREWDSGRRVNLGDNETKENYIPVASVAEVEQALVLYMTNPDALRPAAEDNTTTALTTTTDKTRLIALKETMTAERAKFRAVAEIVERRLNALRSRAHELKEQVREVMRVIGAIEMYLGIYQDVVCIREGMPATPDTPISLRQQILFMDEEAGDVRPRGDHWGIDWRNVEDFDAWVAKPTNTARLLPEPRGAVLIRPSRQRRSYSDNPWVNAMIAEGNHYCYLLVRNGEQLYRIWLDAKLSVDRLFPSMDEFEKLRQSKWDWDGRKAKDKEMGYKENLLLIQGLIDRTQVFAPIAAHIKLSDPDTYQNLLVLIRDDEAALTDGRPTFREWQQEINRHIKRGSRVILAWGRDWVNRKDYTDRFLRDTKTLYDLPDSGLYTVEEAESSSIYYNEREQYPNGRKPVLVIKYLPDTSTYNYEERKNRLSFTIYPSDSFILNYDGVGLDDLEFYLNCRLYRGDYLQLIPLLWQLREERLAEIEQEKGLVQLVAARLACHESVVWGAVEWWKNKVIWKRPVRSDDAKALRMIEQKILRDRNKA